MIFLVLSGGHFMRTFPNAGYGVRFAALVAVVLMAWIAVKPAQAESYKVLYAFTGSPDGAFPYAGLVLDAAGNLYGTTYQGGTGNCTNNGVTGCGVVFKLDSSGTETVLYNFTSQSDGGYPFAALLLDKTGNLYGTAELAGDLTCDPPVGCGTVFEIDASGKETTLYSFQGGPADGALPKAGLIRDAAGSLYGTTSEGGYLGNGCAVSGGCGAVFKLDAAGRESLLHSFKGNSIGDGAHPAASLTQGDDGSLYGTTADGGSKTRCSTGRGVRSSV